MSLFLNNSLLTHPLSTDWNGHLEPALRELARVKPGDQLQMIPSSDSENHENQPARTRLDVTRYDNSLYGNVCALFLSCLQGSPIETRLMKCAWPLFQTAMDAAFQETDPSYRLCMVSDAIDGFEKLQKSHPTCHHLGVITGLAQDRMDLLTRQRLAAKQHSEREHRHLQELYQSRISPAQTRGANPRSAFHFLANQLRFFGTIYSDKIEAAELSKVFALFERECEQSASIHEKMCAEESEDTRRKMAAQEAEQRMRDLDEMPDYQDTVGVTIPAGYRLRENDKERPGHLTMVNVVKEKDEKDKKDNSYTVVECNAGSAHGGESWKDWDQGHRITKGKPVTRYSHLTRQEAQDLMQRALIWAYSSTNDIVEEVAKGYREFVFGPLEDKKDKSYGMHLKRLQSGPNCTMRSPREWIALSLQREDSKNWRKSREILEVANLFERFGVPPSSEDHWPRNVVKAL